MSLLPSTWGVPDALRARVGASAGRQRLLVESGHHLLILHDIPDSHDPTVRDGRLFCRFPDGTWRSTGSADASIRPLEEHLDRYKMELDALEDGVESATRSDDWFGILQRVTPLCRTATNMARVLDEFRRALGPDARVIAVRDRAVDIERGAELVRAWAAQGLEHALARANEEQAKLGTFLAASSHRLNLVAAMTFPLTAVGSFFGVNLASGVENSLSPYLFWAVGLGSVALGLALRASMPKPPEGTPLSPALAGATRRRASRVG